MARQQNFFYQSPMASIGNSLGTALFGDPGMHNAQIKAQSEAALREAQTGEATAHGGLYTSQTTQQDTRNTARAGLPSFINDLFTSQLPPQAAAPVDGGQVAPPADPHVAGQMALAHIIGALAQTDENPDVGKVMGSIGAFGGGDELARRGLIAAGHTPGKEFAVDSTRADAIRNDEQAAGLAQAMGVARTNHANDVPVANIHAGASRDVAAINHRNDIPVANIKAGSASDVAGIKSGGTAPGFDAIQRALPGATESSGERSPQHNRDVGGVPNSYHVPGNHPGSQAYDIPAQPGMSVHEAARAIEAANPGVRVVEARDEAGRVGPNGKALGGWHFALQGSGNGGATAKPPKGISAATDRLLSSTIERRLGGAPATFGPDGAQLTARIPQSQFDENAYSMAKSRTIELYRQNGNLEQSVTQAIGEARSGKLVVGGKRLVSRKSGGGERALAQAAIDKGHDYASVAAHFKQNTGQDF